MNHFDILTFGSITLDMIIPIPEDSGLDLIEKNKQPFLQIPLGEKVGLKNSFTVCGGGSANSAIGFSKLGFHCAAFGVLGDKSNRKFILSELEEQNICTKYITTAKHQQSSFSVVLCHHTGRRTVLHRRAFSANFNRKTLKNTPPTKALYLSHIYDGPDAILQDLPQWKQQNKAFIGWNPGSTQFKKGFKAFLDVFPAIDMIILNREEAERFTGIKSKTVRISDCKASIVGQKVVGLSECTLADIGDVRELAKKFLSAGVKTVVITDGGRGAQIFEGKDHYYTPSQKTKKVDTLGAGDAFSVGVIAARLHGKSLKEQILWGNYNSNNVIQYYGAQAGQLKQTEMEDLVKNSIE